MHRSTRLAAILAAAGTALALTGTAPALAGTRAPASPCVRVTGHGTAITISRNVIRDGRACFTVSTVNPATPDGGGSSPVLFRTARGASLARVLADAKDEFSDNPATAARGTRELVRDARFFGLAGVVPGHPETVSENLSPGTYWLADIAATISAGKPAVLTRLTVVRGGTFSFASAQVPVLVTSADRFIAPRSWPHRGSYLFANVADTIHFMAITRVKPGTTDAQIQRFFNSRSQAAPPFAMNGPGGGNEVVSPGHLLRVSYDLPRGTYVLLCFVADDMTGMPHALMGMHLVIRLV